jgi:hypothetical protein
VVGEVAGVLCAEWAGGRGLKGTLKMMIELSIYRDDIHVFCYYLKDWRRLSVDECPRMFPQDILFY